MSREQQYQGRNPQRLKANKKRQRQLDWEDTRRPAWVAWLSGICLIAMGFGVIAMSASDLTAKPPNINGDQLGAFDGTPAQLNRVLKSHACDKRGGESRLSTSNSLSRYVPARTVTDRLALNCARSCALKCG